MFRKSALAVAAITLAGALHAADTFVIDNDHSTIGFSVKHMAVATTKGKFSDYTGTIVYDAKDITKSMVNVVIKSTSVDTDNAKRDEHLRGADFLDTARFPEITFASTKIVKQGLAYEAVGKLTIKGVGREVRIPFSLTGPVKDPWGNTRLGAEGVLTINRQDYGVNFNTVLDNGGLVVGNDVKIELAVEAIQQQPKK